MIRSLFTCLLMCCFIQIAASQTTFGVKAGANLATLNQGDQFDYKFGANFGAVANIPIGIDFSLQPELLYSSQGYRRNFDNGVREVGKIDYFILPVLVDFHIGDGFSLQGGPQLGVNIRNEREVEGGIGENTSLFVNDLDFAAAVGLQYFIDQSFFVQGRYTFGLSEVVRNIGQRNGVLSLSLGFFFGPTNAALAKDIEE